MNPTETLRFENAQVEDTPFLHFVAPDFLEERAAELLLDWFERDAVWLQKDIDDFYESFDISLRNSKLPEALQFLISEPFLVGVREQVGRRLDAKLGPKTDVTAHKLVPGYHIGIHTDFGSVKQTHRLLVQLNRGWTARNGGLLMFVDGDIPSEDTSKQKIYLPRHRSAFCFEVSERSFHAVSRVAAGDRYTLCISFYGEESA